MFCEKCGANIKEIRKFCPKCGAKLDTEPPVAPAAYPGGSFAQKKEKPPRPPKQPRVYYPPSSGVKTLSVVLCILICVFGSLAVMIASVRIGANEQNVRASFRSGTLADLVINTAEGEKSFSDMVAEGAVDAKTEEKVELDKNVIRDYLKRNSVNDFVEQMAVDYAECFVNGKTPVNLNADAIGNFLGTQSYDFAHETGYVIPKASINKIKDRINGGDLSYMSIDSSGGYFKQKYGLDPHIISTLMSVWLMVVSFVMTAVFVGLLFFINLKNPIHSLKLGGKTFIIFGAAHFFIAALMFIVGAAKNTFFISGVLKTIALGAGTFALGAVIIGIGCVLLKGALEKNAVVND